MGTNIVSGDVKVLWDQDTGLVAGYVDRNGDEQPVLGSSAAIAAAALAGSWGVASKYFFRVDGTAATLSACVGPETDAAQCGNAALLASSKIPPGSSVYLSIEGGSWSGLTLTGDKISGASPDMPVNLYFDAGRYNSTASNAWILYLDGGVTPVENLRVYDLWGECTYVAGLSEAVCSLKGTVGYASADSVKFIRCRARCLGGDGFSQLSGAGKGTVEYIDCDAIDCGSAHVKTESDQGYTAHNVGQVAILIRSNATNCNESVSFVGGSICDWRSGSSTGALNCHAKADSGGTVKIGAGVTINQNNTSSALFNLPVSGAASAIRVNGATVNVTAHSATPSYIYGQLSVSGGAWTVNSSSASINVLASGSISFERASLAMTNFTRFLSSVGSTAATINFRRNKVNLAGASDAGSTRNIVYYTGGCNGDVSANEWTELGSDVSRVQIEADAGAITANHNTVYQAVNSGTGTWMQDKKVAGVPSVNNIFFNVPYPYYGAGSALQKNYSCFINSGSAVGANSITTDPLFAAAPTDYRLGSSSPSKTAGTASSTAADVCGISFHATTPSLGANQHV